MEFNPLKEDGPRGFFFFNQNKIMKCGVDSKIKNLKIILGVSKCKKMELTCLYLIQHVIPIDLINIFY